MNWLPLIVFLMLAISIIQSIRVMLEKESNIGKSLMNYAAGFFLIIGSIGFFGTALSGMGALSWIPASFEWPILTSTNAVRLENGFLVVPHIPSGRIQVYDENRAFVTGWYVNSNTEEFRLARGSQNNIQVDFPNDKSSFEYDIKGNLMGASSYTKKLQKETNAIGNVKLSQPLYLFPLYHPFTALACIVVGFFLYTFKRKFLAHET